jgi:integrase
MPRLTETRALRATLPRKGQVIQRCSEIVGFGCRLTSKGARSWIVQCRLNGQELRITLGAVGTLPFEGPPNKPGARDLAIAAITAARRGEDPRVAVGQVRAPEGLTLAEVWQSYVDAGYPKLRGVGHKRASTIKADTDRFNARVKPALGDEAVGRIDTARVRRWLDTIRSQGQRSHSLILLKSLLSFAASRGLATPHKIAITANRSREVQSFYKPDELAKLDETLAAMAAEKPAQILPLSALRLLIATGARLGEILSLRREAVDLDHGVLALERDKTSDNRRDILLTAKAVAILRALPRTKSRFVFFADSKSGHIVTLQKPWLAAIERAGVRRLRKHDLRHSFASTAIREGVSLYTVGKLLGHKQPTTTARYSHLEHDVARAALERIARATGGAK